MFTGLVQSMGRVVGRRGFSLDVEGALAKVRVGDSVAVNGVCLTVVGVSGPARRRRMRFDLSRETLDRTTLGDATTGREVNLEPALRVGDSLGGHMVQGHVDGVGRLAARTPVPGGSLFTFSFPAFMAPYFVHKGSVAVDGISLTLLRPRRGRFGVAVIPHTEKVTTLGRARVGDRVNLEADVIAKQVASLMRSWRRR